MHAIRRRLAAASLVVLVAGCASSSSGSGAGSRTTQTGTQTGTQTCRTAALSVRLDIAQAGAAAGTEYYPIDFTNTSSAECRLAGFPGVSVVSAASENGRELGAAAQHDPGFSPVAVRVAPLGHAHAWLEVGTAGSYPAAACRPTAATWLRVYPPGGTTARYAPARFTACAAPGATQLAVMPVRAGLGSRGSTP